MVIVAAVMVGVVSISEAIGRVFWAWISDIITRRFTFVVMFLPQAALLWIFAGGMGRCLRLCTAAVRKHETNNWELPGRLRAQRDGYCVYAAFANYSAAWQIRRLGHRWRTT